MTDIETIELAIRRTLAAGSSRNWHEAFAALADELNRMKQPNGDGSVTWAQDPINAGTPRNDAGYKLRWVP